jgi:hypothetical protein
MYLVANRVLYSLIGYVGSVYAVNSYAVSDFEEFHKQRMV